jgi:hypothetical protein
VDYGSTTFLDDAEDAPAAPPRIDTTRCPICGHRVRNFFDHADVECARGMTVDHVAGLVAS